MAGKSGGEDDLRIVGMGIDDEVFVGGEGVHASGGVRDLSIERGNPGSDQGERIACSSLGWITRSMVEGVQR